MKRRNEVLSRHKPLVKKFRRNPVIATGLYTCLYADTIEAYKNDATVNSGYPYILVVVDGLSRQSFVRPMKTKSSAECAQLLGDIFSTLDLPGHTMFMTDQGNEFKGEVALLLDDWNMTPVKLTGVKAALAERFKCVE
ncbi:Oidioi.mRNA.OKI2018_I69.chr1.g1127.t1.cds [Oikopleura dioica]|uniref:Oidioi.mRNA.OKI2018_I69.chr1.g1127.t1.cds n=1 Tax=Oikopleura dioica TaxID=34765 RepID=A0ABN7SLY1_OIKDI|nr:Oidioi.mRNA.OKI2018_I69.chr1.g1127.t1.cds [Oikopleura dioica]